MNPPRINPAEYVIQVFGGVRALARAIGRTPSTVSHWRKPRLARGQAGDIPSDAQRIIMKIATVRGLDITADDLVHGRLIKN